MCSRCLRKKLHSLHDNLISLQLTNVFRDCIAEDLFNVTQGYQIGGPNTSASSAPRPSPPRGARLLTWTHATATPRISRRISVLHECLAWNLIRDIYILVKDHRNLIWIYYYSSILCSYSWVCFVWLGDSTIQHGRRTSLLHTVITWLSCFLDTFI